MLLAFLGWTSVDVFSGRDPETLTSCLHVDEIRGLIPSGVIISHRKRKWAGAGLRVPRRNSHRTHVIRQGLDIIA